MLNHIRGREVKLAAPLRSQGWHSFPPLLLRVTLDSRDCDCGMYAEEDRQCFFSLCDKLQCDAAAAATTVQKEVVGCFTRIRGKHVLAFALSGWWLK